MQRFGCPRCGANVPFDAMRCRHCEALLGYHPPTRTIVDLHPTGDAATFTAGADAVELWRCLNASWGCNWLLPSDEPTEWCDSCRLTHGRPAMSDPSAVDAWSVTEAWKRRLLHHLATLGLPIDARSADRPDGLRFELVYVPGAPAVTGHLGGVVTIDLTEADDARRESLRHRFDEPTRTVLGHLRHEIGHYYWPHLVRTATEIAAFRALFGDERADYRGALDEHQASGGVGWDRSRHVSRYASAHPAEDWAETFAHYLAIRDATETADSYGITGFDSGAGRAAPTIADRVAVWQGVTGALDAIAESLGAGSLYPFELSPHVLDKLAFVDQLVTARRVPAPCRVDV